MTNDAAAGSTSATAETKSKSEGVRLEDYASDTDSQDSIPELEDAAVGSTQLGDGATDLPIDFSQRQAISRREERTQHADQDGLEANTGCQSRDYSQVQKYFVRH